MATALKSGIEFKVASPCNMRWEDMQGDARARYCTACRLNVYNLSEHTAEEIRALMERTGGNICGRLYQRRDGTVLTKDCRWGRDRARLLMGAGLTSAVALVATLLLLPGTAPGASFSSRFVWWSNQVRHLPIVGALIDFVHPRASTGALKSETSMAPVSSQPMRRKNLSSFGTRDGI